MRRTKGQTQVNNKPNEPGNSSGGNNDNADQLRQLCNQLSKRIVNEAIKQVSDMDTCEGLLAMLLNKQTNLDAKFRCADCGSSRQQQQQRRRRQTDAASIDNHLPVPARAAQPIQYVSSSANEHDGQGDVEADEAYGDTPLRVAPAAAQCPLCSGSGHLELYGPRAGGHASHYVDVRRVRLAAAAAAAAVTVATASSQGAGPASAAVARAAAASPPPTHRPLPNADELEQLVAELRQERRKLAEQIAHLAAATRGLGGAGAASDALSPGAGDRRRAHSSEAIKSPQRAAAPAAQLPPPPPAPATPVVVHGTLLSSSIQRMKRMDTLKRRKMKRNEQQRQEQSPAHAGDSAAGQSAAPPSATVSFGDSGGTGGRRKEVSNVEPIDEQPEEVGATSPVAPPGGSSATSIYGQYGRSIRNSLANFLGSHPTLQSMQQAAASRSERSTPVKQSQQQQQQQQQQQVAPARRLPEAEGYIDDIENSDQVASGARRARSRPNKRFSFARSVWANSPFGSPKRTAHAAGTITIASNQQQQPPHQQVSGTRASSVSVGSRGSSLIKSEQSFMRTESSSSSGAGGVRYSSPAATGASQVRQHRTGERRTNGGGSGGGGGGSATRRSCSCLRSSASDQSVNGRAAQVS